MYRRDARPSAAALRTDPTAISGSPPKTGPGISTSADTGFLVTTWPPPVLVGALASWPLLACGATVGLASDRSETGTTTSSSTDESGVSDSSTEDDTTTLDPTTGPGSPTCGLPAFEALIETSGPHRTSITNIALQDRSRPTAANGSFEGSPVRDLPTTVWMPADDLGEPAPLVVYAHGLTANALDGGYLAEWWASWGYVVAAPDFPLSTTDAPGGPTPADIASQPGGRCIRDRRAPRLLVEPGVAALRPDRSRSCRADGPITRGPHHALTAVGSSASGRVRHPPRNPRLLHRPRSVRSARTPDHRHPRRRRRRHAVFGARRIHTRLRRLVGVGRPSRGRHAHRLQRARPGGRGHARPR